MSESEILNVVYRYLLAQPDVFVRRNNTGVFRAPGGRLVRAGLGVGGPDLVGSITVMHEGRAFAQAIGIEVKSATGRISVEQQAWHDGAVLFRWRMCVVRSVEDTRMFIESLRSGS